MRISKTVWRLLMLPWSVVKEVLSWVFLGLGLVFFLLGIACFAMSDTARKNRKWNVVDERAERLRIEKTSQFLLGMAKANGRRPGSPSHLPIKPFHHPDE